MKQTLFILSMFFLVLACRHKPNFDNLKTVSYSTDIQPIIISNCTQSNCHGSVHSESFTLLTYDELIKHTNVQAGSPETSQLYSVIRSYNPSQVMPIKPYDPLTEKQIQLIYVWIGQGALNN